MSAPSTTPTSVDSISRIGSSKSHTFQISRGSGATHSLDNFNHLDSDTEPKLDCDNIFTDISSTLSHTSSDPEMSYFPSTYCHSSCDSISSSTSTTSSSRVPTPPSFLNNPPQTPLGPHATSFLPIPSPLCLGPSLCRADLGNGLEGEEVCLDEHCDEYDAVENQDHEFSTHTQAMTLPTDSVVSHPNSQDGATIFREADPFVPSSTGTVHHALHRKKSMLNLRDEFWRMSSTCAGT